MPWRRTACSYSLFSAGILLVACAAALSGHASLRSSLFTFLVPLLVSLSPLRRGLKSALGCNDTSLSRLKVSLTYFLSHMYCKHTKYIRTCRMGIKQRT